MSYAEAVLAYAEQIGRSVDFAERRIEDMAHEVARDAAADAYDDAQEAA